MYSKQNPFKAKILSKQLLVKDGSSKQTYHLSLDINGSELKYKPGDSIAIFPQNNPLLVQHILKRLSATGDEIITDKRTGKQITVEKFLTYHANLSRVTSSFLKVIFENENLLENKNKLNDLFQKENKEKLLKYLAQNHPIDVLEEYDVRDLTLQDVCAQFSPLLPRFYSISSAQSVHPDEIHLTVALYTFTHNGEQKFGVASHFLCNIASENETCIPMYIHPTQTFTLPEDDQTPIIMVGPGTGIAPFRAFLQERLNSNTNTKNWLFFGERNKNSDFFYGDYFSDLEKQGKLKLSLAFSRDQEEKIYVQHKMIEESKEIWNWLESGAYFYVCGDAEKMAKDVENALLQIAKQEGNLTDEEAKQYLKSLRSQKRYRTDVY